MKLFFRIKSTAFHSNDFFFFIWGNRESFCFHLLISNVHNLPTTYFNFAPKLLCLTFWNFPTFCNFTIYQHLFPSSFTNNWDLYTSVTRTRVLHFLFLKPAKFLSYPFCVLNCEELLSYGGKHTLFQVHERALQCAGGCQCAALVNCTTLCWAQLQLELARGAHRDSRPAVTGSALRLALQLPVACSCSAAGSGHPTLKASSQH